MTFAEQLFGHMDTLVNGGLTALGVAVGSTLGQIAMFSLAIGWFFYARRKAKA